MKKEGPSKPCAQKGRKRKSPECSPRLALPLLFTLLVLCFMTVTLLVVGSVILVLVHLDVLTGPAQVLLSFVVSAFLVGAIMTFFLGKLPLKPVNRLIDQINRLAAGDYRASLHYNAFWGRHPTIVELTDSFNRLAQELQSTEMLRGDFVNNFSHEFKTPIVSIAGFAKLLRRGSLPPAQQEHYLSIIEEESLRLSQLATNVLNLTKVENQTILTDISTFNLSEQIRSCILLLIGLWEKKEIDFSLSLEEYDIAANEELLKQVWINLLDNAVKFSPEKGTVEICIRDTKETLAVSVTNTGPDIPPEAQEKIFHKFYQADESHAGEGNGVGLAVVKRVVELHRGRVWAESGQGVTCFTVELPKKQR